ncbi:hypothetical protein PR003_g23262 [Phytophthora rubi]|uniref:SCP domain-containing protein n=1 Tax=Phytophthora rubi TaxID=129364 RepID=A0A6A3IYW1_9STRA|nr:hypothetical protein PR002_g22642 [Phytophthora rubi]KAE8988249.1 hypothetical protein PR001_g22093 [Phytophthora rubi]KAE9298357.1 hypothetical protein PR003_g23262 [Phytophthora rubi]
MVNIRSVFTFACVALMASVNATSDEHRTLQAVNFRIELLDAINAVRKTEGLKPMCINEMLMDSAQNQANDMADGNFIKSTGSDGSTPKQRAADQGFKAAEVTEVVGAGYRTASSIVTAWAKSASAKSTLLSKHNVMGPGYTFDKTRKYVHFWAVGFATGECGDGTATAGAGPAGSSSGNGSGSVEFPAPAPAPASNEDSDKDSDKDSGSGSAPAPAGTPAVTPAPAGSGSEDPASGSGAETPVVTPAPAGSGAETPASGSGEPPAAAPASTRAPAPAAAPAGTPAPAAAPAGTPAPATAPAATPAPAADSGSDEETPASGAGTTAAPATETQ